MSFDKIKMFYLTAGVFFVFYTEYIIMNQTESEILIKILRCTSTRFSFQYIVRIIIVDYVATF